MSAASLSPAFDFVISNARDRPWDASTGEQRANFSKIAGSIVTQISEDVGVGSAS